MLSHHFQGVLKKQTKCVIIHSIKRTATEMRKHGTKNLTYTQRLQIETLFNAKMSKQEIAKQVGVCLRTIQRELKRGEYEHTTKHSNFWYGTKYKKVKRYSADISQQRYDFLCTAKGRPLKIGKDYELINYINNRVKTERITPHAVWGEIQYKQMPFNTKFSKTTLYNYMELGLIDNKKLGASKKHKKRKSKAIKRVSRGVSIEKRPEEIKARNTFGHWEMDCVCGSTKATFLVLTERLTRQEIICKMENQKANSVLSCLNTIERKFGKKFKQVFKSITVDNGSEFLDYQALEKSIYGCNNKRTQLYYCHPYCSCERGTNERINREIRRLVPKGSNLANYSNADVEDIQNWVNNYPRKVLGFATSQELFNKYLQAIA